MCFRNLQKAESKLEKLGQALSEVDRKVASLRDKFEKASMANRNFHLFYIQLFILYSVLFLFHILNLHWELLAAIFFVSLYSNTCVLFSSEM